MVMLKLCFCAVRLGYWVHLMCNEPDIDGRKSTHRHTHTFTLQHPITFTKAFLSLGQIHILNSTVNFI